MLFVDVEHNGLVRLKLTQSAVTLISFHHKKRALHAASCVTAQLRCQRAHGKTRIRTERLQRMRQQRGGGGFAVHARDANTTSLVRQRREQHCPTHHGKALLLSHGEFRVVCANGRAINHKVRPSGSQLFRRVPDKNFRTAFAQLTNPGIFTQIRSVHGKARIEQ